MARFICGAFITGLCGLPQTALAHGFGGHGVRGTTAYYPVYVAPLPVASVFCYAPVPVVVVAPLVCPPVLTEAVPVATPYAIPTPAPPSSTPAPPAASGPKQPPKITESHSPASRYPVATATSAPAPHRIGFWNLTGRDVAVKVDGQTHRLPPGHAVTVHVERQFVWQLDQREPQHERLPEDKTTLEIVIRN
jgi:hypothetical protein